MSTIMQTKTINTKKVNFRTVKPTEFDLITDFDKDSFYREMTEKEFNSSLYTKKLSIKIIEYNEEPIGYFVIKFLKDTYVIVRMTIDKNLRRMGVGTRIFDLIKKKLNLAYRHTINVFVDERNLEAQLFLQSNDFMWISTRTRQDSVYGIYCMSYCIIPTEV